MPIRIPHASNLPDPGKIAMRQALGVVQERAGAIDKLGNTIANVGRPFEKIALQIQEANNVKAINEAKLDMHQAQAEFLQGLQDNYEEETWVPNAEGVSQAVRESIMERNLSPAAQRRLEAVLGDMEGKFLLKVGGMAANQIADRAREAGMLAAEMAINNQDQNGYLAAIQDMLDAGIVSPEQGQRMEYEGGRKMREAALREAIMVDPIGTGEAIDNGEWDDVPVGARSSGKYRATVEANRMKREAYDDAMAGIESGEYFSEEQIDGLAEQYGLSAKHTAAMKQRANEANPDPQDIVTFRELSNKIATYDPQGDDEAQSNLTALQADIVGSGLSGSMMSRLRSQLLSSVDSPARSKSVSAQHRGAYEELMNSYSKQGMFGMEFDEDGIAIPETTRKSAAVEARIADEMDAWIVSQGDGVTRQAVMEEFNNRVSGYAAETTASSILNTPTAIDPVGPTPRDDDGLPQRREGEEDGPSSTLLPMPEADPVMILDAFMGL